MKIFKDDKVYVQKNNIAIMNMISDCIPASVYMKIFGRGIMIVSDHNRYDFDEFNDPELVEFFRSQSWITDYDDVKDLNEQELVELGDRVVEDRNDLATMYNAMSKEEREKRSEIRAQCELLEYQLLELRDINLFKHHKLSMKLPKGVEYPKGEKSKKGIKQFIKSIFRIQKEDI